MVSCYSLKMQFEGAPQDKWEQVSNALLNPLRIGLGYKIWNAETSTTTAKIASIFTVILAFTFWLIPTIVGLITFKISKSHPRNMRSFLENEKQARIQSAIPQTFAASKASKASPIKIKIIEDQLKELSNVAHRNKELIKHLNFIYKTIREFVNDSDNIQDYAYFLGNIFQFYSYDEDKKYSDKDRLFRKELALAFILGGKKPELLPSSTLSSADLETYFRNEKREVLEPAFKFLMESPVNDIVDAFLSVPKWYEFGCINNILFLLGNELPKSKDEIPKALKLCELNKKLAIAKNDNDRHFKVADLIFSYELQVKEMQCELTLEETLEILAKIEPLLVLEGPTWRAERLRADVHKQIAYKMYRVAESQANSLQKKKLQIDSYQEILKALRIADSTSWGYESKKSEYIVDKALYAMTCLEAGYPVASQADIGKWIEQALTYFKTHDFDVKESMLSLMVAYRFEDVFGNDTAKKTEINTTLDKVVKKFNISNENRDKLEKEYKYSILKQKK